MKKIVVVFSLILWWLHITIEVLSIVDIPETHNGKIIFFENLAKDTSKWVPYNAKDCEVKISYDRKNNAVCMKYNLKDTEQWVAIERKCDIALPQNYIIKFKMFALGCVNNLEVKFLDENGSVFGTKFPIEPDNKWQEIIIPSEDVGYFWGGDEKLDKICGIGFAVSDIEGWEGEIKISDLQIQEISLPPYNKKTKNTLLDSFEIKNGWNIYNSHRAKIKVYTCTSKERNKKVLVAEYDLGSDVEKKWVALEKNFINLDSKIKPDKSCIEFFLKADGAVNCLEFKIVDADGTVFGKKFENLPSKWTKFKIPIKDMEYWWGGEDKELTNPKKIGFAISTIEGKDGAVYFDSLKAYK